MALFAFAIAACSNGVSSPEPFPQPAPTPPIEDASRWVRLDGLSPDSVPYTFGTDVVVRGSGFYGLQSVTFVTPDGQEFPGAVYTSRIVGDSLITVRTPRSLPRWVTADMIVSEGRAVGEELPYQQSDTLRNAITFVGPVPGDTLVWEYRIFYHNGEQPFVQRWSVADFPLKVHFDPTWPASFVEDLWRGARAWENRIAPGLPSFVRVSNSAMADIVFETAPDPNKAATLNEMGTGPTISRAIIMIGRNRAIKREGSTTSIFLGAHEVGHALGLPHSYRSQDVMRWVGSLPWEDSGISVGDIHTLRALYQAEPGY